VVEKATKTAIAKTERKSVFLKAHFYTLTRITIITTTTTIHFPAHFTILFLSLSLSPPLQANGSFCVANHRADSRWR
jgi:hypothetical protein